MDVLYFIGTVYFSEVEFECFLMEYVFSFLARPSVAPVSFYPAPSCIMFPVWSVECVISDSYPDSCTFPVASPLQYVCVNTPIHT